MFEDIRKDDSKVVIGTPSKIEDMFDRIDPVAEAQSAVQSGRLTPVGGAPPGVPAGPQGSGSRIGPPDPLTHLSQVDEWSTKKSKRGMFVAILIVVLVAGAGVAAYYFFFSGSPAAPENTPPAVNAPGSNTNTIAPTNETPSVTTNTNEQIPATARIDSDNDGLTDLEEQSYGTDPSVPDTDSDGVADRDELMVYKTNPLLTDTDNDGLLDRDELFTWRTDPNDSDSDDDTYLDGAEAQSGYDPNGPGKLPPTNL